MAYIYKSIITFTIFSQIKKIGYIFRYREYNILFYKPVCSGFQVTEIIIKWGQKSKPKNQKFQNTPLRLGYNSQWTIGESLAFAAPCLRGGGGCTQASSQYNKRSSNPVSLRQTGNVKNWGYKIKHKAKEPVITTQVPHPMCPISW